MITLKHSRFHVKMKIRVGGGGMGVGDDWENCGHGVYQHFKQYFSYMVAVSSIGGENRRAGIKPPSCRKSLTIFIT
jgi:hypothetical protein